MIRFLLFVLLCGSGVKAAQSQTLPANTCGVVYSYDAAGQRTIRQYICNNGFMAKSPDVQKNSVVAEQVMALYPNPTTGKLFITFTQPLKNAVVTVVAADGKNVLQIRKSGGSIDLDLSGVLSGMYYIQIRDGSNYIVQKVIKQN